MIAHLEVRTRHLRQSFLEAGEFLLSSLLDLLSDDERAATFFTRRFEANPSTFRESLAEEFGKRKIPAELVEALVRLTMPAIPAFIQSQRAEFPRFAAALRAALPQILRKAAKTGHIRGLVKSIAPQMRVERYAALSYAIAKVTGTSLILSDSMVLFDVEGPRRYKAFLDKSDRLNAVYLPLNSKTTLVGTRGGIPSIPPGLQEATARCSFEYFIAGEKSLSNEPLHGLIGSDAAPLTRAELAEILDQLLRGPDV